MKSSTCCYGVSTVWAVVTLAMLLGTASALFLGAKIGDITPQEERGEKPMILDGATVDINCTINPDAYDIEDCNSSCIYFNYMAEKIPERYVTILSENSVNLRYPHVSLSSGPNFFVMCNLNETMFDPTGKENLMVSAKSYKIVREPLEPSNFSCVVYNWEKMVCTWEPKSQNIYTHLRTTSNLIWTTQLNESSRWSECKQLGENSCGWGFTEEDKFKYGSTYYLQVNITTALGSVVSKIIKQPTKIIVQPGAVDSRHIKINTSSTAAQLSWLPPNKDHPGNVRYSITYESKWDNETNVKILEFDSSNPWLMLTHLWPYSEYRYSIRSIPVGGGFWSNITNGSFTTRAAAPAHSPQVTNGSFEIHRKCGPNCNNITVHWKPLAEQYWYGNRLEYKVTTDSKPWCLLHTEGRPTWDYWVTTPYMNFPLAANCSVNITLRAVNPKGSTLQPSFLHIPSAPSKPLKFVTRIFNDSSVQISWKKPHNKNVVSHTVFWCIGHHSNHKCLGAVDWSVVDSPADQYALHFPSNAGQYIIGLSQETPQGSSGMQWTTCYYDDRHKASSPLIKLSSQQEHNSIQVEWASAPCKDQKAYITHYTVYYCKVESCQENNTQSCLGSYQSLEVGGEETFYTISGLEALGSYEVYMDSVSVAGRSEDHSNVVCMKTTKTWASAVVIFGIVVGVLVGTILVIAGIVFVILKCNKFHRWFTKGIEIKVPERTTPAAINVSSSKPLMTSSPVDESVKWSFMHQSSVESNKSGDGINGINGLASKPARLHSHPNDADAEDIFIEDNYIVNKSKNGYMKVDAIGNPSYFRLDTSGKLMSNGIANRPLPKVEEEMLSPMTPMIAANPGYGVVDNSETQISVV